MNALTKFAPFLSEGYALNQEEVGLTAATALRMIRALEGSKLAIRSIDVWRKAA